MTIVMLVGRLPPCGVWGTRSDTSFIRTGKDKRHTSYGKGQTEAGARRALWAMTVGVRDDTSAMERIAVTVALHLFCLSVDLL